MLTLPRDGGGQAETFDQHGRRLVGRQEVSYVYGAQSSYVASFDELTVEEGYAENGAASKVPSPLGFQLSTDLRTLLDQGSVRDTGLAKRNGRAVRRLVQRKRLPGEGTATFVYNVDPDTFAPIAAELRFPSRAQPAPNGRSIPAPRATDIVFTVLAYKRIPLDARTAKLLTIPTTPKTKVTRVSAAERRRQQREAQKGCHPRSNGTRVCPVPPRRP